MGARRWPRWAGAGRRRCSTRCAPLADDADPARAASPPTSPGSSARRCGRCRRRPRRCWRAMAGREADPAVLAVIAEALGHLGEPWGLGVAARDCAGTPTRRSATASSTRSRAARTRLAVAALVELSRDREPAIRDWATFALGTLDRAGLAGAARRARGAARRRRPGDADRGGPRAGAARRPARGRARARACSPQAERGARRWSRHALRRGDDPAGGAQRGRALRAAPAGSSTTAGAGRRWSASSRARSSAACPTAA